MICALSASAWEKQSIQNTETNTFPERLPCQAHRPPVRVKRSVIHCWDCMLALALVCRWDRKSQEGTGTFLSGSAGSCKWHPSSMRWFSSTNMKTPGTKHTDGLSVISTAQLGQAPTSLLPGTNTNPLRARCRTHNSVCISSG